MTNFQHFLTIGQLSKLSGIHTKALRYYEQIGILKPSQVNPDNGYRYYSHSHIPYVSLIKMCADYGLPLKDFTNYMLADDQIDMVKIIQEAQAKILATEKQVRKDKDYLHKLQQQLLLSQQIDHRQQFHLDETNECYALFPFKGQMLSSDYYNQVRHCLLELDDVQLDYDNRIGCYYAYQEENFKQYMALKVKECLDRTDLPFICLNQQHIHAEHIHQDDIADKLQTLQAEKEIIDFLILETFENPYHLSQPHLELRYLIND
ncbi:MerR family DNA-binding transcriptional regulator [Streptococcus cuniculipharyngis]|uniref:MerR family DNA-binding transcriptional regulator n=1 Tax=Streptococcus cuniculipharyngis TaxID=1562651 RepID=A0A5C5SAY7_9STRE|nr:MerR family DNA-binding transcriptional regulator [Streptococcus cuniculipharyngis]TWS98047.1 MerR family DNA-binding transcriptional regulator [Streptococcus cuniculipharyngis]